MEKKIPKLVVHPWEFTSGCCPHCGEKVPRKGNRGEVWKCHCGKMTVRPMTAKDFWKLLHGEDSIC